MFATIPKSVLRSLQTVPRPIVPRQSKLPVLGCVVLSVHPNDPFTINLQATDLELFLTARFRLVEPAVPGFALVPFLEFSRIQPDGDVHLYLADGKAVIASTSGGPKFTLESHPLDDAVPCPPIPGNCAITDLGRDFFTALATALPFASVDETRYVLNGVFATATATVATDGRRLVKIDANGPPLDIIIPTKTVKAVTALFGAGATVHISPDRDHAVFMTPDITLHSRLIDGNYPNYRQVIPDRVDTTAVISFATPEAVQNFLAKIPDRSKRAVHLSKAGPYSVRFEHPSGTLTTPAGMDGDFREFAFNPSFFASCLKAAGPTCHVLDPMSPVTFRSPTSLAVCMLMKVHQPTPETEPEPAAP